MRPSSSAPARLCQVLATLLAVACLAAAPARAAPESAGKAPPAVALHVAQLQGRQMDGRPFDLPALRGKVVLVVFWSTGCAVCRDMLPELRANYAGWRGKPFELVTVATDSRRQDVLDYERVLERIVPLAERFPALWRGDAAHRDDFGPASQLPALFLLDRQGRVVERFAGRVPPEAWDRIAELMP